MIVQHIKNCKKCLNDKPCDKVSELIMAYDADLISSMYSSLRYTALADRKDKEK